MRYKGSVISATPPTTSSTTATGVWTLPQQMQAQGAGNWPYGGPFTYIEDVFSTYLYTGNGSTQTITNGINLSTNGGMVWTKCRSNAQNNFVFDTIRGPNSPLITNTNGDVTDNYNTYFSPDTNIVLGTSTGYSLAQTGGGTNTNNYTYASWTFRKQPKFFDVVTYTGTGSVATIAHNLGAVPGCVIVKDLDAGGYNWQVYHISLTSAAYSIQLNQTAAQSSQPTIWNSTAPTSTNFTVGTSSAVNASGKTYVAYLFASNAGGFGLTGNDNVVTCGSFTYSGSAVTVNLGYEPQFIIAKGSDRVIGWEMYDVMRGMPAGTGSNTAQLVPNTSAAESVAGYPYHPTATGFIVDAGYYTNPTTVIYIAIRRGPMKVPTVGTSVFSPNTSSASAGTALVTNFPVDLSISTLRSSTDGRYFSDRLRGVNSTGQTANQPYLSSNTTNAEASAASFPRGWDNTQILVPPYYAGVSSIWWNLRRAPGFFDEVCYTGTGSATTVSHNLNAVPEIIILKGRSIISNWYVGSNIFATNWNQGCLLDNSGAANTWSGNVFNATAPTSTIFSLGGVTSNASGSTYVAYLFATCPGVSKVGSYSGTGATQTIDCGFTGGARFVLIKRTDSTGDWYAWDTARGMVAGTDPSTLLNTTAAEVNANSVYTTGVGFQIVSTAAGINASGGTYIFLAVA